MARAKQAARSEADTSAKVEEKPLKKSPAADKEPPLPVTYEPAPDTVYARMDRVKGKWHTDMEDAGVKIALEFAVAGKNSKGVKPAIISRGQVKTYKVKRNDVHARLDGACDALIILDKSHYEATTAAGQDAILDEALSCLMVKREGDSEDGEVKMDSAERPILKIRHYDRVIELHDEVLKRHGEQIPDAKKVAQLVDDSRQLQLFQDVIA